MIGKYFLSMVLFLAAFQVNAEFNLENNADRPSYIQQGYRNVLNSLFLYTHNDKYASLNQYGFNIPSHYIGLGAEARVNNENKLKGLDYYYLNYFPYVVVDGRKINLPFIILDVSALGGSIIYNDERISIFSIESYTNPVSNNDYKKFKSEVFIIDRNFYGVYNPSFLTVRMRLNTVHDVPNEFSRLVSINYNKVKETYKIQYELQRLPLDFDAGGTVLYEKNPIIYSFDLKLSKDRSKHPFFIEKFVEKRKNNKEVISNDFNGGQFYYYLN